MPNEIKRNLEKEGIYLNRWWTGLIKNRSPLFTPISAMGVTIIQRQDVLWDGLNVMLTPQYSLKRRYGFSKAETSAFGVNEWPLTFTDFQPLSGVVTPIVDTQTNVYSFVYPSGTKTSIYTKLAGATQSSFQNVLNWLYWVDGKSANKWDGSNTWNMGIAAPSAAPTVVTTQSGVAAGTWQSSTYFLTAGLVVDPNNNVQLLISVAGGTAVGSAGTVGTSSSGQPSWNQTLYGLTTDNTVTWRNVGKVVTWTANTSFNTIGNAINGGGGNVSCICNAAGGYFVNVGNSGYSAGGMTGGYPFNGGFTVGQYISDNQCVWLCIGTSGVNSQSRSNQPPPKWAPSTSYPAFPTYSFIIEPFIVPQGNATEYLQAVPSGDGGTSASGYSAANFGTTLGALSGLDNQLTWICCGSKTWAALTAYTKFSVAGAAYSVVVDNNGSFWGCTVGGTSGASTPFQTTTGSGDAVYWAANTVMSVGATIIDTNSNIQKVTAISSDFKTGGSAPSWSFVKGNTTTDNHVTWTNQGSAYGKTISDPPTGATNPVIWVNLGRSVNWAAGAKYYLPTGGFLPSASASLASPDINDGTNIEFVVQSGLSGSSTPVWAVTLNAETLDNGNGQVVWENNGPPAAHSLTWSKGYFYAYSYKARTLTDFYSVASGTPPLIPTPPGWTGPLPAPTGSKSGAISTASPVLTISGSNAGAINTLTLTGSTDPQVDTIVIWRSLDGGPSSLLYELTEIPNPAVINGQAGTTQYADFQADSVLNTLIVAPQNGANNPPPSGLTLLTWYAGRLWGAVGNTLYYSGGPDTTPGVGTEAWPPGNNFPLIGAITALIPTSSGLIISVNDDAYVTIGTTSATFTVPTLWQKNFGVPTSNAVDQDGDTVFFFTTKNQLFKFSASGFEEIGDGIAAQLAAMTAKNVYVAMHRSGTDEGVFVSDGSANLYRYSQKSNAWDVVYQPVNGCNAIASTEVSNGNWQLLMGRPTGSGFILHRDLTTFQDDGSSYSAFAIVGSLIVAPTRQTAQVNAVLIQAPIVGIYPTISVLVNEYIDQGQYPSTFITLPIHVPDPPRSANFGQKTVWMQRHDMAGAQAPIPYSEIEHLQVRIDFGVQNAANELWALGLA